MAEVDAFGRERSPTADSVDSAFPYVNAVIQEGLRLYPPATTAVRECKEGMTLGAYDIPAGTALQVSRIGCSLFPPCRCLCSCAWTLDQALLTTQWLGCADMSVLACPLLSSPQPFPACCLSANAGQHLQHAPQ